ncbi:MAG: FG-GAP repeat protein [Phycisphaerales bacterium]|nr:FG-GAP repeat protein [Phycisphaerales bacterium]
MPRHLCCAALIAAGVLARACQAQFVEPDAEALYFIDGEGGGYAWAVSELADVDGDGLGDWITGAPRLATTSGNQSGRLYVYSGATGLLLYSFDGPSASSNLGYAMADAGDVDADGVHDIAGGANGAQGGVSAGNVLVYSGATGALLWTATGEELREGFGGAVAGIGDVDGDGRDDLLVGAPLTDGDSGTNAGRAYVVSGLDGSVLRVHKGAAPGDQLGIGVSGVGDIDNDGVPDYAASAQKGGPTNHGSCMVFSGADGSPLLELLADETGTNFGQFFVGGVGDFNADGTPYIYVLFGPRRLDPVRLGGGPRRGARVRARGGGCGRRRLRRSGGGGLHPQHPARLWTHLHLQWMQRFRAAHHHQ